MVPKLQTENARTGDGPQQLIKVHITKRRVFHDEVDDGTRYVNTARSFDSLKARGGVDFEHQRTVRPLEQIHTSDVQPKNSGRTACCFGVFGREVDRFHRSIQVKVASEFPASRSTSHGGHNLAPHDKGTNVFSVRFCNVLLDEDGLPGQQQSLHEVPDFKRRMAQEDTITLRALGDLHHHRQTTNHLDGVFHVNDVSNIRRLGDWHSVSGEDLGSVKLVSTLENALAAVGGPHAQLFDLAKNSNTVLGDGMANSWDDGIVGEGFALVEHVHASIRDGQ